MTNYQIVCVQMKRGHVVAVGVGTTDQKAERHWTVAEVRVALHKGDSFHTVDPITGQRTYIEATDAIRTEDEHLHKVCLNNLRPCDWTKS